MEAIGLVTKIIAVIKVIKLLIFSILVVNFIYLLNKLFSQTKERHWKVKLILKSGL
jgi:hypothetical protein